MSITRSVVVDVANRMIRHLSESGTHADQIKREAIIAVTTTILMDADCYKGFRYDGDQVSKNMLLPMEQRKWDNTRIQFH